MTRQELRQSPAFCRRRELHAYADSLLAIGANQ